MKPISIFHRSEGEDVVRAVLSIWWMKINYGAGPVLRSFGCVLLLPVPIYNRYEDWESGAIRKGWRVPVAELYFGFIRGDKKKPIIKARVWLRAVGKQCVIATREQIQDGMII